MSPNRALHALTQVLPTYLGWPTFLPGHAQLGLPDHVLGHTPAVASQFISWACQIGHKQAGRWASPRMWAVLGPAHLLTNQTGVGTGQ